MFPIKFSIYTHYVIRPTIHIQNSLEVINLDCTLKCDMTPSCTLACFSGTWHHTLFSSGSDDRQSPSEAK